MFLSNGQSVPGTVETLADSTPVYANASYYSSSGVGLLNSFAAYAQIYRTQLWVQTVVKKLSMATARMPFEVKTRVNDTDSVNENGPLQELLSRPNRYLSGLALWEWTSSTRDVYGEAFWLKLRDRQRRVRELHPMHPTNVIVRRLADGSIGYVYSNGTVNTSELPVIPSDDVVSFITYNPDNILRGLSTLEALRMTLLNEDAARRATAAMWQNGARPGMILSTDRTLTPGAAARLKAQSDALYAGADNAGKTAVYEEGIKPTVVQLSAEEMQYIESRKLNREEVCAAYDVPPPVVHILDHATFSNITEQLRSQYRDTMAPRFVNFESVIDHQLVPDFYPDRDHFTRFNMEEVLRGDFETKATAVVSMRNAGLLTGNQAAAYFGLPRSEDPEMDKVYANSALQQLGEPAQRVSLTETASAPADEASIVNGDGAAVEAADKPLQLTATPVRPSVRSLMGSLGAAKQHGSTLKTWHVGAECVDHSVMDGESTFIDSVFTNGYRVPGDVPRGFTGDNWCDCTVTFGRE